MNTRLVGKQGEEVACAYLIRKGYTILETNYYVGHKEVDIIALHSDRLVFIEVKTRAENSLVLPIDSVHRRKQYLLTRAAHAYICYTKQSLEARFDIICVQKRSPLGDFIVTDHIEGAFAP